MRAGHRKRPAAPRPSGIILIAEDQPDLRYLYAAYFHLGNFRVETAVDGQQAFEMAVDLRPDVIVLNLDLPRVDGWELTRRLKSDRRTGHIPVISCSGYTFGRSIDRALDAGCDAYVVKPCSLEELTKTVQDVLGRFEVRRGA